jgi:hypothetical protein
MEFSRSFPWTYGLWRRRAVLTAVIFGVALFSVIAYKVPELAYLYRLNKVLREIIVAHPQSFSESATLRHYCPDLENTAEGIQSRLCSKGDILHPYLTIAVWQNHTEGRRELAMEALLPRRGMEPLHLAVFKNFADARDSVQIKEIPSAQWPKAAAVYLARGSTPKLRAKYACALPFVMCETFSDLVAQQ